MHTLEHLYIEEMKDLYSAEQQILKSLPKMIKAATSPDLKRAFQEHQQQTQVQAERLEQIFSEMGKKPSGKHCKGMEGLIKEGEELLEKQKEGDPAVLDAALIGVAQKIEHYEIAGYGTVSTYAKLLGDRQAHEMLGMSLTEEKDTDELLSELAQSMVNPEAMQAQHKGKYKQTAASK